MFLKNLKYALISLILISNVKEILSLSNLTKNDPYPFFSTYYPFSYLTTKQKEHLAMMDYTYPATRFRFSVSGYRQAADRGRNSERNMVNLGDMNGRWNMLGLFYDPALGTALLDALGISNCFPDDPYNKCKPVICCSQGETNPYECATTVDAGCSCFNIITRPELKDPNKEFGYFTIPMLYRKYGVRFESELLLIDKCFDGVGLKIQFGVADIRQNVQAFQDLTCQALGITCPAYSPDIARGSIKGSPEPYPTVPPAVAPPYTNTADCCAPCVADTTITSLTGGCCGNYGNPLVEENCILQKQEFKQIPDVTCISSYDCDCKRIVREGIMNQKDKIAKILGLDLCNYHNIGLEDLRIELFWRHIFVINEDSEIYPRLLFMPFMEIGAGIPMDREKKTNKAFYVPIGNNGHPSAGFSAGFTLDFLDTIDIYTNAGFTYFFKHDFCGYRLPTNKEESGIYPYTADVSIRPGTNWNFSIGMNAYHFLGNLTFWGEYMYISHKEDKINVCKSNIPEDSIYYKQGFLVDYAECLTKWESQMFNLALNYDISENISIGLLWQAPITQRNAYRSGTVLGSINFIY